MIDRVRWNEQGLVPAIVQDDATGQVLMLAYMSRESLARTLEIGQTVFWSRSRQELWHKGATSGNTQDVVSIHLDCDGDALLLRVRPAGPACHTGEVSCFFTEFST
ncbi:MAG TPA: phosphoribosyl-AMP cyclohydrolase [Aggregatilineales bacterium]|nr:phosphoribosyl-AMP cyclohydrolase [Aggregatilineales bacterium]HPV07979.1 phosphoribosyl-AMP cyclohydrolase [Aggregatilineales bacterium]HQA68495.1 phosphoribosyl-AMP cyclohydrolase [Aggregatilineales bacterium]HQE16877.1 phosphoribosyl-AMP cyclohydrolase [Aggregatilineales bacterium]